ncbi:MAG: RHS repeat-associated core domain-containing protein [Treponema sp.]|jgi:RHS repeat-associated protein|nr:RHS repeat-associated core domain-containing protein [Treponema sp.]
MYADVRGCTRIRRQDEEFFTAKAKKANINMVTGTYGAAYGELWINWHTDTAKEDSTPYRFTGKERDEETGLYYYGARYLDPKTSRWLSSDPAMGDYLPGAPINDDVKKRNGNLPGQGGVFNVVNLHTYHYAGNNPVKYTDPDGKDIRGMIRGALKMGLAISEIVGGAATVAAAAAGEIGTVGLSTAASIALGTLGVTAILDGVSRFALAAGDFTLESLDTGGKQVMDGDILPSSTGGMIGAVIDKKNGVAFSDTGKVGPSQKTGEKINAGITFLSNTADYANTMASSPGPIQAITAEASHQYDIYDTTKTALEK